MLPASAILAIFNLLEIDSGIWGTVNMTSEHLPTKSKGETAWERILMVSMALPGAKVDRGSYLASQLSSHCDDQQVVQAILRRPASAGISPDLIDKLADDCIRRHVLLASGTSFAAGVPGGLALSGTIPADMVQFYWHALVMAQKLAYLYGWPDLLENGEVDEQTEIYLTLLIGAMLGAAVASEALAEVAKRFAEQTVRRLPRQALTKTWYYPIVKQVGKWIGVGVTKRGFAGGLAKVVPVIGAVFSDGVTAATMRPMSKRLKNHLRTLRYAFPDELGADPHAC